MSGHSIYTCQRRTERSEFVLKLKQSGRVNRDGCVPADENGDFITLLFPLTLSLTKTHLYC